jgi:hypothetical protein
MSEQHSPVQIEVALHYWYRVDDHPKVFDTTAYAEAAGWLVRAGLLTTVTDRPYFIKTEGLQLYIEALCAVPWPKKVWHMPGTGGEPK